MEQSWSREEFDRLSRKVDEGLAESREQTAELIAQRSQLDTHIYNSGSQQDRLKDRLDQLFDTICFLFLCAVIVVLVATQAILVAVRVH